MEEEKGGQEVVEVEEDPGKGEQLISFTFHCKIIEMEEVGRVCVKYIDGVFSGFIGTDLTCLPHPLMWQTQLVCRSFRSSSMSINKS